MSCHRSVPRFLTDESPTELAALSQKNMPAFLDQAKHWGASVSFRRDLETVMKEKGSVALLPLDDMRRANRETRLSLYPRYRDRV